MATLLNRPVKRELLGSVARQTMIVEIHNWGVRLRPKRRRIAYELSWDSIHNRAAQIKALELIKARAAARKARKHGKQN